MRIQIKVIIVLITLTLCPALFAGASEAEPNTELVQPDYTLALASHNQGILQDQNLNQSEQTNPENYKQYPRYKSEEKASMLAFFPGIIVHGIGHIYANAPITGAILFVAEMLAIPMIFNSTSSIFYFGPYERKYSGIKNVLEFTGVLLFLGSWIYDIAHASTAARKYNDKVRAQILFSGDNYNDIKVTLSFAF